MSYTLTVPRRNGLAGVMTRRGFVGLSGPVRRPVNPGLRYARRRRGFGDLNYYDLLAQANLQNCDPMDSTCVSNNAAKQAAVEDYWAAHQSTGVPSGTQLTFAPQTPGQVAQFYSGNPLVGGNVVNDTGIMSVNGVAVNPTPKMSTSPIPLPPIPTSGGTVVPLQSGLPAPGTTGGPAVINSSGVAQTASSSGSFCLSGPGCLFGSSDGIGTTFLLYAGLGAGALYLLFGGGRGR